MNSMDFTMVMYSKLLCHAIKNYRHEKLILDVLLFEDFSRQTVTAFEENVDDFGIVIEENCSKRVSVFDNRSFILKVYEFDGANVSCLEVNLSQYAKDSDVLVLNRFMMGKVMFFLYSVGKFQCILVNEDGVVIEGINQQLQNQNHAFHVNDFPQKHSFYVNPFHVDSDGIVAVMKKENRRHKLYFFN